MAKKITVITYDSDAPACRDLFINQASTAQIGTSEVDLLAKEIHDSGQIAIVSAAASATNQNAWIAAMQETLKDPKYAGLVWDGVVYGNDDPTTSTTVAQGLLSAHPNLKVIVAPTTVGIVAAADTLKEHVVDAVNQLKRMKLEPVMITGDNAETAVAIARQAGIEKYFAEVLPAGKAEAVNLFDNADYLVSGDYPSWWGWYSWPSWWNRCNGIGRVTWKPKLEPGQSLELGYDWHYFWQ